VSTLYPVPDVEEFTVAPTRTARRASAQPDLPVVEWTQADYSRLAEVVTNATVLAALDLCATDPDTWIGLRDVESRADRTWHQARADLSGLTRMIKSRFERSNWPFEAQWEAEGPDQIYYSMTPEQAAMWKATRVALD
jgi:hypothetical protein